MNQKNQSDFFVSMLGVITGGTLLHNIFVGFGCALLLLAFFVATKSVLRDFVEDVIKKFIDKFRGG